MEATFVFENKDIKNIAPLVLTFKEGGLHKLTEIWLPNIPGYLRHCRLIDDWHRVSVPCLAS